VQKDDVSLPFLDLHRAAGEVLQLGGEGRELVIMGREQPAATAGFVQILNHGPGDRETVIGRRAAADLVQNNQAFRGCLIEDGRGFDHLDHEGGAPARKLVGGTDPRKEAIDRADDRTFGRNEASRLRQHRDQRILAQERALTRHVRAGQQPKPLALAKVHRMAAADDQKAVAIVDLRSSIALLIRKLGKAGGNVETRQCLRGPGNAVCELQNLGSQRLELFLLESKRSICGTGDLGLEISQLLGRIAGRVRHALTLHETRRHFIPMGRRDLDEIAEHVVMADLERRDANLVLDPRLQLGDMPFGLVAKATMLIELL